MDTETGQFLWQSLGPKKLILAAPVLDFYGSQISVRSGRVLVPGGTGAENAWKDLVGASPRSPADFISRLLAKDSGWLASYFDTLSRVSPTQQAYFTAPAAWSGFTTRFAGTTSIPSQPSIPSGRTRRSFCSRRGCKFEPNGQPHIPGNIDVWREVLRRKTESKTHPRLGREGRGLEQSRAGGRRDGRCLPVRDARRSGLQLSDVNGDRPRARHRRSGSTFRLLACWPKNSRSSATSIPCLRNFTL